LKLQEGGDSWGGASAIIVPAGSASEGFRYSKTSSLYLWLLGYEFTGKLICLRLQCFIYASIYPFATVSHHLAF